MSTKKVIIAGASGMVGGLVYQNAITSSEVNEVVILSRKPSGLTDSKVTEVIIKDFENYTGYETYFQNVDAAYFCIGVYSGAVADAIFKKITVNYAVQMGKMLSSQSPNANYCLLSGQGADRTEKSRVAFAKYKGMAENQLSALNLGGFSTFRPSYIYPVAARNEPNMVYKVSRMLYPIIKLLGKNYSIKSTELASAIFKVGMNGNGQEVIENKDILKLA